MKKFRKLSPAILILPTILLAISYLLSRFLIFEIIISFFVQITVLIAIWFLAILILGLVRRNRKILLINLVNLFCLGLCIFNIFTTYAGFIFMTSLPIPGIKILSANIYYGNQNYSEILELIEKNNADVVVLIEYTNEHHDELFAKLYNTYPYSVDNIPNSFGRIIIYSKTPIEKIETGLNKYFVTAVKFKNSPNTKLLAIHPPAPVAPIYFETRNEFFDDLSNYVNSSDSADIIVGDFNLSPFSYHYQKFNSKVQDNHYNPLTAGAPKFSWKMPSVPFSYSHIDHFFISKSISTQNCSIQDLQGSDHDAIVCELNIQL